MSDQANDWVNVADVEGLGTGEMLAVEIGGFQLALYNVGGSFHATDNICSHAYALLTDGWLDDMVVECPLHGGQFDVCTGKAICAPAEANIRTYPVRVVDGHLQILLAP